MVIVRGVVAGIATMEDGRTQILSLHFKGEVIGSATDRPLMHELVAMTDVDLCHQHHTEFANVLGSEIGFRMAVLENAQDAVDQSRSWMLALGTKTARERVATFLSFLVSRGVAGPVVEGKNLTLALPLMREEIGNFLGLTIETVSRQFSALRRAGIIDGKGREVTILDLNRLVSEACDEDGLVPA